MTAVKTMLRITGPRTLRKRIYSFELTIVCQKRGDAIATESKVFCAARLQVDASIYGNSPHFRLLMNSPPMGRDLPPGRPSSRYCIV
jgi:hypothetical protein